MTKRGTPNTSYLVWTFFEESAIPFLICKTTSESLAKGRTPIHSLFTKSLSCPRLQFLCKLSNQGPRIRRRKSLEASRSFHVSKNRQFPLSLYTHFSGLSSIRMVFWLSMQVLPMNSFSERTFRNIFFDPPITIRYLPREVSILRQLSYPRISNGSAKPQKRYWTIFSTVDLFIEFQMRTWAANLLIVVKNSCKLGCVKTAFEGLVDTSNGTIYRLYWEQYLATSEGLSTLQRTHLSGHTDPKLRSWPDNQ
jgi:hypothetical protein